MRVAQPLVRVAPPLVRVAQPLVRVAHPLVRVAPPLVRVLNHSCEWLNHSTPIVNPPPPSYRALGVNSSALIGATCLARLQGRAVANSFSIGFQLFPAPFCVCLRKEDKHPPGSQATYRRGEAFACAWVGGEKKQAKKTRDRGITRHVGCKHEYRPSN